MPHGPGLCFAGCDRFVPGANNGGPVAAAHRRPAALTVAARPDLPHASETVIWLSNWKLRLATTCPPGAWGIVQSSREAYLSFRAMSMRLKTGQLCEESGFTTQQTLLLRHRQAKEARWRRVVQGRLRRRNRIVGAKFVPHLVSQFFLSSRMS